MKNVMHNGSIKLGKMEMVPLRDVWENEERDFSKWLAEKENLEMLGNVIGAMELEPVEREARVGKYRLDIMAKDGEHTVIIENQLEESDHGHLGKLITYAAGNEADVVVWIVKKANEEHRKAIEWLNNRTDSKIGFFLLEIEMWRIGDSAPAPKFNVVESPNEWAKVEKDENITEANRLCQKFWGAFNDYLDSKPEFLEVFNKRKPRPQNWYDFAIGKSTCHLVVGALVSRKELKAGLYVYKDSGLSELFIENKHLMEESLGGTIDVGTGKDKSFYLKKKFDIEKDVEEWNKCFAWYCEVLPRFREVVYQILDGNK